MTRAEILEIGEMKPTDPELIRLAYELDEAAYAYWLRYQHIKTGKPGAVLWLQNYETGHFVVFTRGEYVKNIKEALLSALEELP